MGLELGLGFGLGCCGQSQVRRKKSGNYSPTHHPPADWHLRSPCDSKAIAGIKEKVAAGSEINADQQAKLTSEDQVKAEVAAAEAELAAL